MTGGKDPEDLGGSPACLLHEFDVNGGPVDRQQALDVARWRRAERERLIAARLALSAAERVAQTSALVGELDRLPVTSAGTVVSVYWPIRGEPDLRSWMYAQWEQGVRLALPMAVALHRPMTFREWTPAAPLARGVLQLPYPSSGAEVVPDTILVPGVGFDEAGYRLGYGGGLVDRTLARMATKSQIVGIGFPCALLRTLYPQAQEVPLTRVVTGSTPR